VVQVDEKNIIVKLILYADLGAYFYGLCSGHQVGDGNFHFNLGILRGPGSPTARSVEVDKQGSILYQIESNTPEYRTFRLQDLYTSGY
jgi:hypothetical protein